MVGLSWHHRPFDVRSPCIPYALLSIRRSSLKTNTIRTLMLVKHQLRMARNAVEELLGDEDS